MTSCYAHDDNSAGSVVSTFAKMPGWQSADQRCLFSSVPNQQRLTSTPRLAENDWEIELDGTMNNEQMTVTVICLAASDDTTAANAKDGSGSRRSQTRSRNHEWQVGARETSAGQLSE